MYSTKGLSGTVHAVVLVKQKASQTEDWGSGLFVVMWGGFWLTEGKLCPSIF